MMLMLAILAQVAEPLSGYAQYGVLGLTILGLGIAVSKLYADNGKLRDRMESLFTENALALKELATALQRLSDNLDIARRLEAIERKRGGDGN